MKILQLRLCPGEARYSDMDYSTDYVLHGLRQLEHVEVVDEFRLWYMYKSTFFNPDYVKQRDVYGRGFTIYDTLPDETVDRTDIESKIRNNYFDLIIADRKIHGALWNAVQQSVDKRKVCIVDGDDRPQLVTHLSDQYLYFKRELQQEPNERLLPISFAFPAEKTSIPVEKERALADYQPVSGQWFSNETYPYNDEKQYYHDYNRSLFATTISRAGWDTNRHYEIMGSRCVPWFKDIDFCPPYSCTTLPKSDLSEVNKLVNLKGPEAFMSGLDRQWYDDMQARILAHFDTHCTTIALAKYILDNTVMKQ